MGNVCTPNLINFAHKWASASDILFTGKIGWAIVPTLDSDSSVQDCCASRFDKVVPWGPS